MCYENLKVWKLKHITPPIKTAYLKKTYQPIPFFNYPLFFVGIIYNNPLMGNQLKFKQKIELKLKFEMTLVQKHQAQLSYLDYIQFKWSHIGQQTIMSQVKGRL